jgi:hypothetical protein
VILWFAGFSVVAVWMIFHDPAFDYRLVVVGALLPDVIDIWFGGARVTHAFVTSAVVLMVVMMATRHRRTLRRRLLAIPIGMFLHLVLDGMWTDQRVFWWPFLGPSFRGTSLPSGAHPVAVVVVQEVAGGIALWWAWMRFRLNEPDRRSRFWRTGRLGRDLVTE